MGSRRPGAVVSAVLAAGVLAALAGCDWFQSSDPSQRSSPVISNLSIQPSSVLCGQEFTVSFQYEDPQGDLSNARVTIEPTGLSEPKPATREEYLPWPEGISSSSGRASFPLAFPAPCTGEGGTWTITVQAEDEREHTSNKLSGQVTLTSAG